MEALWFKQQGSPKYLNAFYFLFFVNEATCHYILNMGDEGNNCVLLK